MRIFFVSCTLLFLTSCVRSGIFEQTKRFPLQEWASRDSVTCKFHLDEDKSCLVYFVIRHNDAYHFRNIWVNVSARMPDSSLTFRREFQLADGQHWLGTGMDDVFDHRILFSSAARILKKGDYTFVLKQDMREDPLQSVLSAGIRIEETQ